jgi:cytochrome P450
VTMLPGPKPPLPPLAEGLPVLGSLPALLSKQAAVFTAMRARYGDIYRLRLGPLQVTMLNHPRHVQHILRDRSTKYGKGGDLWRSVRTLLGNGLAVSEGEFWLRQRRMMQPHFHRQRLGDLTTLMMDAIDEELLPWDVAAHRGTPLSATHAFNPITMKVIAKVLSGGDVYREEIAAISSNLAFALDYVFRGIIAQQLPAWVPVPGRRRYQQALRDIDAILFKIIERSRCSASPPAKDVSLIAMLLAMVDAETGEQMTSSQVRDEAVNLFLAGYETTALGLSWTLQFLLHNPAVLTRLQAEVDDVLGGRRAEFSDLRHLSATRMAFQEALRLSPPIWWLTRFALEADEIDGHCIPAGTTVTALPYTIHRHPDLWEDPERFDLERFTPERSVQRHQLAWIPFGTGQRQCIGKDLALMEGQLVLARIVQRYTITAAAALSRPPSSALSMTLRIKNGTPFRVSRRNAHGVNASRRG